MIPGTVNAKTEIVVTLPIRDATSGWFDLEFVLDTGFNGELTVPAERISRLGLDFYSTGEATVADDRVESVDVYTGTLIWDGRPRSVLVQSLGSTPLLGTLLLAGHDLRARLVPGGAVEIEEVP